MHTIADAGRLIPTAQKPPCAIESRPRKGSRNLIKKPLECAAFLGEQKRCAVAHTLLESQNTPSLIKDDRCVRMLVSRSRSRNEVTENQRIERVHGQSTTHIREPKEFKPLTKKIQYRMVLHIFCDVLALRYQYKRKWQTRSKNVVAQTHTPLSEP
jgi:hypothetical protein